MKESLQTWKRLRFLLMTGESIPPGVSILIQGAGANTDAGNAFAIDASEHDVPAVSFVGPRNRKI